MTPFDVEFEWPVADAYELRRMYYPQSGGKKFEIVPKMGARVSKRRPLETSPTLYKEFLNLDGSREASLRFASQYGLLFKDSSRPDHEDHWPSSGYAEPEQLWEHWIHQLKELDTVCQNHDRARQTYGIHGSLELKLEVEKTGPPVLKMVCPSLLAAMQVQCVRTALGGQTSYRCSECSRFFVVGPGGHRSHAKYCSVRCKDRANNRLKREKRIALEAESFRRAAPER